MKNCRDLNQNILSHPIDASINKIITKDSKIFTMGSCFAYEIYHYLKNKGYDVLTKQLSDDEPELIWYNTYTMRYEFEKVIGAFTQEQNDYWNTPRGLQDPYRRFVFGSKKQELHDKISKIDEIIRNGILTSDVIVLTLGLTEVFFQNSNNKAICASPGYGSGGGHDTRVKFTTYGENYDNVNEIMNIIKRINPKAKVILTVSPVPLGMTYSKYDHVVANTESKSVLRAVAGEIVRNHEHSNYFHSYEIATSLDRQHVFIQDARHVKKDFVLHIMKEFEKYFVEE